MKLKISLFVLSFLFLVCTSCKKNNMSCPIGELEVHFHGFSDSDFLNASIVAFYDTDLNNPILNLGTFTIGAYSYNPPITSGYQLMFYDPNASKGSKPIAPFLQYLYNYKLVLPAVSRTYLFTNMSPGIEVSLPNATCFDLIKTCDINGQTTSAVVDSSFSLSSSIVDINK